MYAGQGTETPSCVGGANFLIPDLVQPGPIFCLTPGDRARLSDYPYRFARFMQLHDLNFENRRHMTIREKKIYVTEEDAAGLRRTIEARRDSMSADAANLEMLEEELDRAEIVPADNLPPDVVTMQSRVRLTDLDSGKALTYQLVFPNQADIRKGRLSVLAPIGTALLGYRVGDIIEWSTPGGERRLKVEAIIERAEANGKA